MDSQDSQASNEKGGPIIIAGGGIGGLSAAIAMARKGIRVHIVERQAEFSTAGAGIQLGPSATRLLRSWGVAGALERRAGAPDCIRVYDGLSGSRLTSLPLGAYAESRYGAPYWIAHRADLQAALLATAQELPEITISRSFIFERCDVTAQGVTVGAQNGATVSGKALVGADGVHSVTRKALFGHYRLLFSGRTAWRALIPANQAPAPVCENNVGLWLAPHAHFVHYPVEAGRTISLVAVIADDPAPEGWGAPASAAALAPHFSRWSSEVRSLLRSVNTWKRWSLMRLNSPLPRWSQGPVTLLGDAAHPVMPFLASGGVLAIEDAATLAEEVAKSPDDVAAAFHRYELVRLPRAHRVQSESWRNGLIYHSAGLVRWARNKFISRRQPEALLARNDWLYAYRASSEA
jgi:salicylate hydroxylase